MIALKGGSLRDPIFPYPYPYFSQIFLVTIFRIINHPDFLVHLAAQNNSYFIEMVHAHNIGSYQQASIYQFDSD
jgi:hypothetical protein